ncbi:MAG: tannase/feruloyl esterase family alpha/beta hydrolase, partial [Bryobacteraceae bacterium]
ASFAQDHQKLLDYAFRSLHVTAETAKRIASAYYGARPTLSYFQGCSTGGRQALILAQRFPADFDGIVAGAPVLNFTGTMVQFACDQQAVAAGPIPYGKLSLLADRIYGECDARDGLKDGLIDDPRRCDFSPARDLPKCAAGTDRADCFTAMQIGALERVYGDIVSSGRRILPGWPIGGEIAGPNGHSGWRAWIVQENGGPTIETGYVEQFFRYMASPRPDPRFNLADFDVNKDPQRLGRIHRILDATDTDLAGFKARGGKLLMFHGWADQALNARVSVEYYTAVTKRMGPSTPDFFRLFMVPGMFHCGGGVGTGTFDMLAPLIAWVEHGTAPDTIPAARIVDGKTVRTRPLCPYPQVARYKGSGGIDAAENFSCVAPPAN